MRERGNLLRTIVGVALALAWAVPGLGVPARAAPPTVVTAGSLQVTFGGSMQKGALGDVDGYASLGFNFETGQAGMFGDVQIGQDSSGNPTLSGDLAAVPPSDTLSSAPTNATLTVSAGESLLVFDSAGNYVLVQITNATGQAVYFTYTIQTATAAAQPPAAQGQGSSSGGQTTQSTPGQTTSSGTGTPATQSGTTAGGQGTPSTQSQSQQQTTPPPPTQSSTPSATQSSTAGVYAMSGNCLTVADSAGDGGLGVGVVVSPMFSGQTIATAQPNKELLLNVAISAPSDVTSVTAKQSGQVGGFPFTQNLYGYGQNGGDWTFSMQQTDFNDVYQILITSQTLAGDGIANPSTGVTEVDWTFNTTQGCGSGGTQTVQAGAAQGQGQSQSQGTQSAPASAPTQSAQSTQSSSSQGGQAPISVALQIGSASATVNGQPASLIAPAQIDSAGRTMVPFRFLGQALGATVSWDNASHTASYQLGSTDVAVTIGSTTATVNGQTVSLDAPAVIVDGSTMVPARFISEALGAHVGWDPSTQTVTITYGAP